LVPHHICDFTAHVEFANAVRVVILMEFVTVGGRVDRILRTIRAVAGEYGKALQNERGAQPRRDEFHESLSTKMPRGMGTRGTRPSEARPVGSRLSEFGYDFLACGHGIPFDGRRPSGKRRSHTAMGKSEKLAKKRTAGSEL